MNIINNPNISFDWNLNNVWVEGESWVRGISGQYGRTIHDFEGYCKNKTCLTCMNSKANDPNYVKIVEKVPIPSSLWFFIKVTNKDDYELVKNFLSKFDENDHDTKVNIPNITSQYGEIKPEYQQLCEQINKLNEQINVTNEELRVHVEKLYLTKQKEYDKKYNALVNINDTTYNPDYNEYCNLEVFGYRYPNYIYETYDDYNVTFDICARKGSKFYDEFLIKYELIEKHWPSKMDREIVTYVEKSTGIEQL